MSHLTQTPTNHSHHVHRAPTGLDAVNYPLRTESGPRTDEYVVETAEGYIRPEEEAEQPSPTPTVHAAHDLTPAEREKGLDIKLVTWKEDDPEDPKNLSRGRKWCVPPSPFPPSLRPALTSATLPRVITAAISYCCFAVALGSSLTVMDMPEVAAEFGVSIDLIHLSISVFVFGFGIGESSSSTSLRHRSC